MLVFFSLTYRNAPHVALGLGINSPLKLMLSRHGRWYAACGFQIDHDAVLREDQVEVADHRDRPALALGGDADLFLRMLFVFWELRLAELHQLLDGELRHRLDAPALGAGLVVADRKALVELFKCLVDRGCLTVAHQDLHDCVFDTDPTPGGWSHRRAPAEQVRHHPDIWCIGVQVDARRRQMVDVVLDKAVRNLRHAP
jgi:hypothetical protein